MDEDERDEYELSLEMIEQRNRDRELLEKELDEWVEILKEKVKQNKKNYGNF